MSLQRQDNIFNTPESLEDQAFKEGIQCNAASGWTRICWNWCSHQKRRLGKTHVRTQKKMGIHKAMRTVLEEINLTDIFDLRLTAFATMRK